MLMPVKTTSAPPTQKRSVRIFRNGRSQAIRIPREFALTGTEVVITRDSRGRLILQPTSDHPLSDLLHSWGPLGSADSLPHIPDLPADDVSL